MFKGVMVVRPSRTAEYMYIIFAACLAFWPHARKTHAKPNVNLHSRWIEIFLPSHLSSACHLRTRQASAVAAPSPRTMIMPLDTSR